MFPKRHSVTIDIEHNIDFVTYIVKENGVLIYTCTTTVRKWCDSESPLRNFELWLMDEKPKGRRYITCNGCNSANLTRNGRPKRFDFKQKLFDVFRN